MNRWINVKDALPERGKKVSVILYNLEEETAELWHNSWLFSEEVLKKHDKLNNLKEIKDMDVLYWRPLNTTY